MKILEIMSEAKIILWLIPLFVFYNATLCVKYKDKIIPLHTAHDGRPILMDKENGIEI